MKNETKTKKITIDKLAVIIKNSFEGLETRVVGVIREEISGVNKEIEGVKNQLQGTNKRIDDYAETKVSKIVFESRIGAVEKKLAVKK